MKKILSFLIFLFAGGYLYSQSVQVPATGGPVVCTVNISSQLDPETMFDPSYAGQFRAKSGPAKVSNVIFDSYQGNNIYKFIINFEPNITTTTVSGSFELFFNYETFNWYDGQDMPPYKEWFTDLFPFEVGYLQLAATTPASNKTKQINYTQAGGADYTQSVAYLDGMGRAQQTIAMGASPTGKDAVSFALYDCMGRADSVSYLPYTVTASSGAKRSNPKSEQQSFYSSMFPGDADASYAYAYKQYDKGLGLVQSAKAVGQNNHTYPVKYEYSLNNTAMPIRKYVLAPNGKDLLFSGYYAANQLTVVKVWRSFSQSDLNTESYEYKNSQGQLIATEVRLSTEDRRITYYVYDEMGRQRYVIPPILQSTIATTNATYSYESLKNYCFYNEYDKYGNLVKQFVPGAEPVYMVYDGRNRLIMSQDGNQRTSNTWTYTKYDLLDRPVYSGTITGGSQESHTAAARSQTVYGEITGSSVHGYTNQTYPTAGISQNNVLTVTYYDNYLWLSGSTHQFSSANGLGNTPVYNNVVGMVTGTLTKVLDPAASTPQWLKSVVYYDNECRTIQTIADLYPTGQEITSNKHNFTGEVIQTRVVQTVGSQTYAYDKWFTIDKFGRLQKVEQQITGDAANGRVTIASYEYDELGRTSKEKIHNNLETTTKEHRVSGALAASTANSFSYRLGFDRAASTGLATLPNGNLAHITWGKGSNLDKSYKFAYHKSGELKDANYCEKNGSTWTETQKFREQASYDLNGNITTIARNDASGNVADNLALNYSGNRLVEAGNSSGVSTVVLQMGPYLLMHDGSPLGMNEALRDLLIEMSGSDHDYTDDFEGINQEYYYGTANGVTLYYTPYFDYEDENIGASAGGGMVAVIDRYQTYCLENGLICPFSIRPQPIAPCQITVQRPASPTGTPATFTYDPNGNMTRDGMTGVSIEYNILNLPSKIFDSSNNIRYIYDANGVKLASLVGSSSTYYRSVMTYAKNGGAAEQLLQIGTQGGLIAREGSSYVYKYLKTDHLGSTRVVLAARAGQLQEEQRTDYYPYGLSHSLSNLHLNKFLFSGKELQDANIGSTGMLGLYDFHARYYNPFLGRWFNIDPALQHLNPYVYCNNTPTAFIDPDGRFPVVAVIVGAIVGGVVAGARANEGSLNLFKWDWSSWQTWRDSFFGSVIGGTSGYVGGVIATSGIPMANTLAIAGASFTNSAGNYIYSGGKTNLGISFGAVSYNITSREWGYLWKKGNRGLENLGYFFGALGNLPDLISLFSGGGENISVNSASTKGEDDEWWGHSSLTKTNEKKDLLISVGPDSPVVKGETLSQTYQNSIKGAMEWNTYVNKADTWKVYLNNVSTNAINGYASGITRWDLLFNSCVGHTSRGLWSAGVPNVLALHPHLLNAQMMMRSVGIYASPYIYQTPKTVK